MVRRRSSAVRSRPLTTIEQYLWKGKWRTIGGFLLTMIAGIIIIIADGQGWLLTQPAEWSRYEGKTFRVVRVIDGDTLDVDAPDDEHAATRIRFWGIDTPETAKPREGTPAQPFADEAWEFTKRLSEGKQVTLKLDAHQTRDRHGRLLAYIVLPDGTMLNELLLLEGLARYEHRYPHEHIERFETLEKKAKSEKKGMWKR